MNRVKCVLVSQLLETVQVIDYQQNLFLFLNTLNYSLNHKLVLE